MLMGPILMRAMLMWTMSLEARSLDGLLRLLLVPVVLIILVIIAFVVVLGRWGAWRARLVGVAAHLIHSVWWRADCLAGSRV